MHATQLTRYTRYMLGYQEEPTSKIKVNSGAGTFDTPEEAEQERPNWQGTHKIVRVTIEEVVEPDWIALADGMATKLVLAGADSDFVLDWLRAGPREFYQQAHAVYDAVVLYHRLHEPPEAKDWGEEQAALWHILRERGVRG